MTIFDVKKLVNPIFRRIMLSIAHGIIKKTDNNQTGQIGILDEEIRDKIRIFQDYGFVSRPLDNSEAIVLFLAGNRDNGVIIATDNVQYRIKVEKGEVALYTDEGDKIHLKRNHIIEIKIDDNTFTMTKDKIESQKDFKITANGTDYNFKSTGIETTADIKAGTIEAAKDVKAPGNITLLTHKHNFSGQGAVLTPTP